MIKGFFWLLLLAGCSSDMRGLGSRVEDGEDGENGLMCWDIDADALCGVAEDVDASGSCDALDCRGPEGLAGAAGQDGADGTPGVNGQDGAEGPSGPQGEPGAQGEAGVPGLNGQNGAAGQNGADGPTGPKGDKGDPGADGLNGQDGAAGLNGADGAKGDKGDPGLKGDPGETGPQGPIGLTGPAGASGSGWVWVDADGVEVGPFTPWGIYKTDMAVVVNQALLVTRHDYIFFVDEYEYLWLVDVITGEVVQLPPRAEVSPINPFKLWFAGSSCNPLAGDGPAISQPSLPRAPFKVRGETAYRVLRDDATAGLAAGSSAYQSSRTEAGSCSGELAVNIILLNPLIQQPNGTWLQVPQTEIIDIEKPADFRGPLHVELR